MIDIFTGTGALLTQKGWKIVIDRLGVPDAALWAVLSVETGGVGHLPDRRPRILYERHVFHQRTGGRFDGSHPDLSSQSPGGYEGGAAEYGSLKRAMLLDRQAALESASWGLGQVMGYHADSLGYAGIDAMIERFKEGEDAQLDACAAFIMKRKELHKAFQAQDWARFAFFYNGANYAKNHYDVKLAAAFGKHSAKPPNLATRAAQARLTYLGYNPRGIDGEAGPGTAEALKAFQRAYKGKVLIVSGTLDPETDSALRAEAGV